MSQRKSRRHAHKHNKPKRADCFDGDEVIVLVTQEGEQFEITRKAARLSAALNAQIEEASSTGSPHELREMRKTAIRRTAETIRIALKGHVEIPETILYLIADFATYRWIPVVNDLSGANNFALIVDYLNHHNGREPADIKKPIRSVHMHNIVKDPWDADFINKLNVKDIYTLLLDANRMGAESLKNLASAKIATMIKGVGALIPEGALLDEAQAEKTRRCSRDEIYGHVVGAAGGGGGGGGGGSRGGGGSIGRRRRRR